MKFKVGEFVILKEKKVLDMLEGENGVRVNWNYVDQFRNRVLAVESIHSNGNISIGGSAAYWNQSWFEIAMEDFGIEELFEI